MMNLKNRALVLYLDAAADLFHKIKCEDYYTCEL